MAYGLRVYSGGDFLQIDSSTNGRFLYEQISSGTLSTSGAGSGGVSQYLGFGSASPGAGTDSIVFIKPSVAASAYLEGSGQSFKIWSTVNTTFSYKVFSPSNGNGVTNNYGLAVYDGNEEKIFSNGYFSTRLAGTITGTGTISGSNLWSSCGVMPQRMIPDVNTPGQIYMWMTTFSSTSVTQQAVLGFPGPQVSDVEDIFTNRWINAYSPTTLILKNF
jgi:hypothetical protein